MIKIYISGNRADVIEREPLTSGTVGKVLNFAFTEDWRLLIKYAVFEGSGRRIALTNIGDSCIIPHEVLAKHGGALRVGVYGRTADGSAATPTVYAQLGIIQRGADPNADPSTKPTLPVWAQIQAQIGDLSNLTTEDKTNLVAAINEAATKSVQPDWDQNDPDQPDYVKNRLAYDSRSDEYDGETVTLTWAQGSEDDPPLLTYLGDISDTLVSYAGKLVGKNKYNENFTTNYDSVYVTHQNVSFGAIDTSVAVNQNNRATSHAPIFLYNPVAREGFEAGLYLMTNELPWNNEHADMTFTITPRFSKSGQIKKIDPKYLGAPAPFNWPYDLAPKDQEDIRGRIGVYEFHGDADAVYNLPFIPHLTNPTQVQILSNNHVEVTYNIRNQKIESAVYGTIFVFRLPSSGLPTSGTLYVDFIIKNRAGSMSIKNLPVRRRYFGSTFMYGTVAWANARAGEWMQLMYLPTNGNHCLDCTNGWIYGAEGILKPIATSKGGVPDGGTKGQVLHKTSNADYNYSWTDFYPSSPKQGQVLVASADVDGYPQSYDLKWQDLTVAASDVVVIKATLASYSDTTFLIDYSPYMIRGLIKDGKFVVLVLNDNNGSNTYTYQYIFGNIYSNPNTPQGDGYGWTMPYAKGVNMVVNRISYVGEENDKYKWEIKKFKIPLEEVTT